MNNWPYYAGIGGVVLLLALQHWFPWPRRLKRLEAYAIGTATVWLGVGMTLGWSPLFWKLLLIPVAGGAGVAIGYAIDRLLNADVRQSLDE
jgi:uncharacterized membrane protein